MAKRATSDGGDIAIEEQPSQKRQKSESPSVWVLVQIEEKCDLNRNSGAMLPKLKNANAFATEGAAEEARYGMMRQHVAELYDDYADYEEEGRDDDDPPIKKFDELTRDEVVDKFHEFNERDNGCNFWPTKFVVRECQVDAVPANVWVLTVTDFIDDYKTSGDNWSRISDTSVFRSRESAEKHKVRCQLSFLVENIRQKEDEIKDSGLMDDPAARRIIDAVTMDEDDYEAKYGETNDYAAEGNSRAEIFDKLYDIVSKGDMVERKQTIEITEEDVFD